ncbi:anti-sigma factor [Paenibacillus durus]|uniref:Anti-sigma-W factor RsiW n=1 Tax=Paenibacillus durus TaxID=44251 RepID=A0A089HTE4_PAEDU|nr:anti-sigma factor [Paenibacillus durus]AIQ14010.1 hypothetical protein PDUR_20375 [Paenibacillus durus]
MNCAEVMEWMHRYLDHDLSRDESLEMFRHIDGCPSCAELFERLNALSSELEQLPDVSPPFSLVDSILPQLEAIDREKAAAAAPSTAETDSPRMSRKASRAKARQNSSLAGRFGIGAAAAAVIFGIAIFNMPEKLPGAQVDDMMKSTSGYNGFKENTSSAANDAGADSGSEESSGGAGEPFAGSEENSPPADAGTSTLAAPESPSPKNGGQAAKGGGVKQDAAEPTEKARSDRAEAPTASTDPGKDRRVANKQTATPMPSANASAAPETGTDDQAGERSDSIMSDKTLQAPQSSGGDMGIMDMAPAELSPDSPSWTSPDRRYTAVVEGNQLVIYRDAAEASEGRQAVDTVAIEGTWVSGKWSEDSRQFTYVMKTDGNEVSGAYTVPQETADPGAAPSASAAPASSPPSPGTSTK